jgi:hypothetical protein
MVGICIQPSFVAARSTLNGLGPNRLDLLRDWSSGITRLPVTSAAALAAFEENRLTKPTLVGDPASYFFNLHSAARDEYWEVSDDDEGSAGAAPVDLLFDLTPLSIQHEMNILAR